MKNVRNGKEFYFSYNSLWGKFQLDLPFFQVKKGTFQFFN